MLLFVSDAHAVFVKDLRIEWRSRVSLGHVLPFALFVLVLFGFTFNANRQILRQVAPGLFWMVVLFATIMTAQSSLRSETDDKAVRILLFNGMSAAAVFVGKTAAVATQLLVVGFVLVPGFVVFYGVDVESWPLVFAACVVAAVGLAAVGSLLSAVVAGSRTHRTALPILLIPLVSPVLIAATRAFDDAFGVFAVNGWPWIGLLSVFVAMNLSVGVVAYPQLLEDI